MEEVLRRYHMVYHSVNNPVCHDSILHTRYMDNSQRLHVSYTFLFETSALGDFYSIRTRSIDLFARNLGLVSHQLRLSALLESQNRCECSVNMNL